MLKFLTSTKNESSICVIGKKEREISASFAVAPQITKVIGTVVSVW